MPHMLMSFRCIVTLITAGTLLFALPLKSVNSTGMADANISFLFGAQEALVVNPAFLAGGRAGYTHQLLDTQRKDYDGYSLEYVTGGGFAQGRVAWNEKTSGDQYRMMLTGFGLSIKDPIKVGVTLENIELTRTANILRTWSTKVGMSYTAHIPQSVHLGVTLEHFFKENSDQTFVDLSPQIQVGIGVSPMNQVLWTHILAYQRKEGQSIQYRTAVALLLDKELMLTAGASREGYALGVDLPISFGRWNNLGRLGYSLFIPMDIREDIRYYFSYTLSM